MISGMTLYLTSPNCKHYEYRIDSEHAPDSVRYELRAYSDNTFMFVRFDRGKPVKTYAGLNIETFELKDHL